MDLLIAGPTPFEAESGLRPPTFPSPTARSGATGFDDLTIRNQTARVRLTGGYDSGGSTVTIANEIFPTLRQFDDVDFVKIYGPAGNPRTRSDPATPSRPAANPEPAQRAVGKGHCNRGLRRPKRRARLGSCGRSGAAVVR